MASEQLSALRIGEQVSYAGAERTVFLYKWYKAAMIKSHLSMQHGLSFATKSVSHTIKKNVSKTFNTPS
eukprot:2730428-Ditylum_brightwellii.AAC.1